jgi:hypothetical protein
MLGRRAEPVLETVRIRTALFGYELAVIGRGHLGPGPGLDIVEASRPPNKYRRLVFDGGALVGAAIFGTGEWVHELSRFVADQAPRDAVEPALRLPSGAPADQLLRQTFAQHCPLCAAELAVRAGTSIGAVIRCGVCNTDLVVRWDGRRGRLEIATP